MIARQPAEETNPFSHPPLRPGSNVRMGSNPLGFWIENPGGGGSDFRHPFLVTVGSGVARVSSGLLIANVSVQPLIGKVQIGGDARNPQPTLRINPSLVNPRSESWVCVEVTPDADGKLDEDLKKSKVEVVQRSHPTVLEGETGRAPLALLFFREGQARVFQIAMFHLRYETAKTGSGKRKHFFL